jgi:hypothetical protein
MGQIPTFTDEVAAGKVREEADLGHLVDAQLLSVGPPSGQGLTDEGNGEQGNGQAIVVQETAHKPDLGLKLQRLDNAARQCGLLRLRAVESSPACYIC